MTPITVFYQGCPVCGRSLRVPVQYFGRQMACSHCRGQFLAGPEERAAAPPPNVADNAASEAACAASSRMGAMLP